MTDYEYNEVGGPEVMHTSAQPPPIQMGSRPITFTTPDGQSLAHITGTPVVSAKSDGPTIVPNIKINKKRNDR